MSRSGKSIETENKLVTARGWKVWACGVLFGMNFCFGTMENFWN